MGTRYQLNVVCPHCGKRNKDVYFAPTSGMGSHECKRCDQRFWIGDDFKGHKEPVDVDMRKHSTWGDQFTKMTKLPAIQKLE